MRIIDGDAIYQWYTEAFDFSPNEIRFSMNDIRDNLYNIPTVEQWIPCSERLPKEEGYYLVTRKNPKGHVTRVRFNPEQVERGAYNSPWGNGDADILAWMPLPEPYGAERKEE